MTGGRSASRQFRELRRPPDWVAVGALRGTCIGGVLPVVYGVAFVAFRIWQSANEPPYDGQTSVSYPNTQGGGWGYAVVTVVYVGTLLLIATGVASTVGLIAGAATGLGASAVDALSGRRRSPSVAALVSIAAVTGGTYPWLAGRTLLGLDPDPWVFLVAVPMVLGVLSLRALPLRRVPA